MSRNANSTPNPHRSHARTPGRIRKAILIAAIWAAAVAGAGVSQAGAAPAATPPKVGSPLAATPAQTALETAPAQPDENGAEVDDRAARDSAVGGRDGCGDERRGRAKGS